MEEERDVEKEGEEKEDGEEEDVGGGCVGPGEEEEESPMKSNKPHHPSG
jgi:hypothetical protein